jgi:hypothetical protein
MALYNEKKRNLAQIGAMLGLGINGSGEREGSDDLSVVVMLAQEGISEKTKDGGGEERGRWENLTRSERKL